MKYIEFAYLGAALIGLTYVITSFDQLPTRNLILALVGIAIMSFLFAFRRAQRISMEKNWEEYQATQSDEENVPTDPSSST